MHSDLGPLTWAALLHTTNPDALSAFVIVGAIAGYDWCQAHHRGGERPVTAGRYWCFGIGVLLWAVATMSAIGAYAHVLFWMRALQVVLLLYVAPVFLAQGQPVTVVRGALGEAGCDRLDAVLGSGVARVLLHPLTTSVAMLGAPWLLYLTPWYTASLEHEVIGFLTGIILVAIGFGYFYARFQTDPVPRKYSQLISLLITVIEAIGDGVLGLVVWQGPLIAESYYAGLHRLWGPAQRTDQTIGAGVLWILGDVVGIPVVLLLMRALGRDEKAHAVEVDAELDTAEGAWGGSSADVQTQSALWWENDPQLRDRYRGY